MFAKIWDALILKRLLTCSRRSWHYAPEASEDFFEIFLIRLAPVSPQENKSNPTRD
jgi:hypothetical protein